MITGIGIDIVEVDRIKRALKNEKFAEKVFTSREIKEAEASKIKYQRLASRFAGKEAVKKAIGISIPFKKVEILRSDSGNPKVRFLGRGKDYTSDVMISLSHTEKYAVALALVTSKNKNK